jgi:activator of HSP90 ATPase
MRPGTDSAAGILARVIRQRIVFSVEPHEVYEALMDSSRHSKFTGEKAAISRDVGGKISAYDGYIDGWNVELAPDKKIVQKWRGSDWPENHYSTAVFELKKTKTGGTVLTFIQTGVPKDQFQAISDGWVENYWDKMKGMFKQTRQAG